MNSSAPRRKTLAPLKTFSVPKTLAPFAIYFAAHSGLAWSSELEIIAAGRLMHGSRHRSSLGPRRANSGFVLVLDDLPNFLRAQKAAAWQEVARRIAHESGTPSHPFSSPRNGFRVIWKNAATLRIPLLAIRN